jgi:hypothetical protein
MATGIRAAEFHISPAGQDDAAGTASKPFASLARARDAARTVAPGEPRRIVVHGGGYYNVAVELAPVDSGLIIESAGGARPVFYGGIRLTNWVREPGGFLVAALPPDRNWQIRMLDVDGRFALRARYPATGTMPHRTSFNVPWMSTTGGGWQRNPTQEELTTLQYNPGDLPASLDITNTEVTVYHMWDESCVGVASHDVASHTLRLAPAPGHPPGAFGVKKFVVWNTREGMTQPGQWYHDRTAQRIVYQPLPGQDMSQLAVIVPTSESILRLRGRPEAMIRNVTVRGITFSVTTVPLVAGGFAAAHYDGAISVQSGADCSFRDITVSRVAGHGINTKGDVTRIGVTDSEFTDCGAGGIYVGGSQSVISNNLVRGIGRLYPSAVGIFRGGRGNLVAHNEIHDCTYSAINYGGVSNIIANNLIHDCMKVLHDGAAIYLFAGRDCVLRGNLARDIVDTGGYGASAYYLDERSTGCVVEGNVSVRVNWPSHNHMATNNIVRENVFVAAGDARITLPRSSGFAFTRNVLYAPGRIRIENPGGVTNWQGNLFYSGAGKIERVPLKNYSNAGSESGAPDGTAVADPLVEVAANGVVRFRSNSPALQMGLTMPDVSRAGRLPR